ncbi:MAG: hypothetical protein ACR2IE_03135 [Candidatus Sumerlaeaceae bacterium]
MTIRLLASVARSVPLLPAILAALAATEDLGAGCRILLAVTCAAALSGCASTRYVAPGCAAPAPKMGAGGFVTGTCKPNVPRPWSPAENYSGADVTTCRTYY